MFGMTTKPLPNMSGMTRRPLPNVKCLKIESHHMSMISYSSDLIFHEDSKYVIKIDMHALVLYLLKIENTHLSSWKRFNRLKMSQEPILYVRQHRYSNRGRTPSVTTHITRSKINTPMFSRGKTPTGKHPRPQPTRPLGAVY
jgi:hypothetical protein